MKDVKAYHKIKKIYEVWDYSELYDVLFHYMNAYMEDDNEMILFRDECENLIGIKQHEDIVKYILNEL